MAYASKNFKTKKALKEAVANGEKIHAWQPGPFPLDTSRNTVSLEGPWYPEPHRWYAVGIIDDYGNIIKVK